jgi:hypothetical protein
MIERGRIVGPRLVQRIEVSAQSLDKIVERDRAYSDALSGDRWQQAIEEAQMRDNV